MRCELTELNIVCSCSVRSCRLSCMRWSRSVSPARLGCRSAGKNFDSSATAAAHQWVFVDECPCDFVKISYIYTTKSPSNHFIWTCPCFFFCFFQTSCSSWWRVWLFLLLLLTVAGLAMLWMWHPPFREQAEVLYSDIETRIEDYLIEMASPRYSGCFRPVWQCQCLGILVSVCPRV